MISKRFLVLSAVIVAGVIGLSMLIVGTYSLPFITMFPAPIQPPRHSEQVSTTNSTNVTVSDLQGQISDLQGQISYYKALEQTINANVTLLQHRITFLQSELSQAQSIENSVENAAVNHMVAGILHFYNTDHCFDTQLNNVQEHGYTISFACHHNNSFLNGTKQLSVTGYFNITIPST